MQTAPRPSAPGPTPPEPIAATAPWLCSEFRRYQKGSLQGFANFQHRDTGLIIHDCAIHERNGRRYVNFPAKAYRKNGATETSYIPVVEIRDQARLKTFQRAALIALNVFLRSPAYRRTERPAR